MMNVLTEKFLMGNQRKKNIFPT